MRGRLRQGQVVSRSGEARSVPQHRRGHAACSPLRRNEKELRREWEGWHTISPPMKKDYARFAELSNKGAKELGFADTGAMWRSKYDMPPDAFAKELDRLWDQVRPLYLELHAYVRMKLREKYGDVVPRERSDSGLSARQHLGAGLVEHLSAGRAGEVRRRLFAHRPAQEPQESTPIDMVKIGERFYTSLGFAPLPQDVLGALAVRPAARSRGGLPRQRVGHRLRVRRPHQDVHRADGRGFLDDPSRARPQLLSARLQGSAGHLPRQRERRLPRSDWRHDRAVGDAGIPGAHRPARQGARRVARHRPADVARAREGRVPAVRPADRSVALEGVFRRGQAGGLQQGVVGSAAEVPGHRAAVSPRRGVLRSGREVSRARQHAVHALFPGRHPAVPVPPRRSRRRPAARRRCIAARSTRARKRASG